MRSHVAILFSTFTLTLTSCVPQEPAGLSDADRAAAEKLSQSFTESVLAKDWEAVANLYAEEALLMPPNAPAVEGRAAIKAFFESFPNVTTLTAVDRRVEGSGDLVAVAGSYEMTMEMEGAAEPIRDKGKYLDVRRKQPDGRWLFVLDTFSSDLPPPAPEPASESEEP